MSKRPCAWAKLCTSPEAPLTLAWAACKEKVGGMVASIMTCAGGEFLAANAGTEHRVARARLIPSDRRGKTWMGPATPVTMQEGGHGGDSLPIPTRYAIPIT